MFDIITELYYLVDENLPIRQYPDDAEKALVASFSPAQNRLFEAYQMEDFRHDEAERLILFRYLVKLGLHIP